MGILVVCQACGGRRTVPGRIYDEKIRGRLVKLPCRHCGAQIRVDGTLPPPPVTDAAATPTSSGDLRRQIPAPARLPEVAESGPEQPGGAARAASFAKPSSTRSPELQAPRERQISHVDGPISERGPTATVGRYALFEQFATGGMATVHFGRLDGAGGFTRVVAIKRLVPHLLENREFTHMLLNEARLAARVRHPNVVATLDVVATKGDVLLVLDYVHGEALSTLCRTQAKQRGQFVPLPIAVGIMQDVLQGLSAIHEATDEKGRSLGLVHRDISPPNVLVGADGVGRVLDFGIATALERIEETATGRRKGKRGYMSPEQIRGERVTQRSDVFSAGIVLWELLAMRRLFPADQEGERADAVLHGDYPHPAALRPELPAALDAITMRAIAREPEQRYATIREFTEALEAAAPRANARRIGEWVMDLARDALSERTRMVARVENWRSGADTSLSSSAFASELPSIRPPEVEAPPAGSLGSETWAAPPAPARTIESASATPAAVPPVSARATIESQPSTHNKLWWVLALLLASVIWYLASRAS